MFTLAHVLLAWAPSVCVCAKHTVRTDISAALPDSKHGQGIPLIKEITQCHIIKNRNQCDCRSSVSHVTSCCVAYSSKDELQLMQR